METIKKNCSIVMLPTNLESNIVIDETSGHLFYLNQKGEASWGHQYLYFLSNYSINKGDYYYDEICKEIHRNTSGSPVTMKCFKKIESSDDPSLNLPAPSLSFIEKYCKSNGTITEVMIECSKVYRTNRKGVTEFQDTKGFYEWKPIIKWEIGREKVVISKVKSSWNTEELKEVLLKFAPHARYETNGMKWTDVVEEWTSKNLNQ